MLVEISGVAAASSDKPGPAKGPNDGAWGCFCGHFAATSGGFPVRLRDVDAGGAWLSGRSADGIGRRDDARPGFAGMRTAAAEDREAMRQFDTRRPRQDFLSRVR